VKRLLALLAIIACGRSTGLPPGRHLPSQRTYTPLFGDPDAAVATSTSIYGLWRRPGGRLILLPDRYVTAISCGGSDRDVIGVSVAARVDATHIETLDRAWQTTDACTLEIVPHDTPACAKPTDRECFAWSGTQLEFRSHQRITAYVKVTDDVSALPR